MQCSTTFHEFITKHNVLQNATKNIGDFFKKHPTVHKVVLIANHIFRALLMTAFCYTLPYSLPANLAICFTVSVFYRLTVEGNCPFKYALPSFAGSIAFPLGLKGLVELTSHAAFSSLKSFSLAGLGVGSLLAYFVYIILTVDYDVDNRSCCG